MTFLCMIGISMSALTVVFGSPLPSAIRAGLSAVRAADAARLVRGYRDAERAALLTLDEAVLAQAPVFAAGEALADLEGRVAALRSSGLYQQIEIESFAVRQVIEDEPYLYVMTDEVIAVTTYHQASGAVADERKSASWEVVYTLVQEADRWKVAKVAAVER